MNAKQLSHYLIGVFIFLREPQSRDERGLSQSTETAILIGAAVTVTAAILAAVTIFVTRKMALLN
jgi:hypothetical protein